MDHWLSRAAQIHPERVALATSEGELSHRELEQLALGAAGALRERGVAPGDRVALALPAGRGFVAALHGCMMAGAIAIPIDLRLSPQDRATRAAAAVVSVGEPLRGAPRSPPEPLWPERTAVVMYTSGTTVAPRPVALSYANLFAGALGSAVALGLDQRERWLCPMPLVHVGGLSIVVRSAIYATTAVLHERFDVAAVAGALMDAGERITLVSLVPTMLSRLLDAGLSDPPTLRWALLGGGPIPPALVRRAAEAGIEVATTYGMTEASSQIATLGWPLPGVEVEIEDDGELLVRGPTVAVGAVARDGWLHTGDLGAFDSRGRLTITGRKADTIITGGENVAPAEVEAVLLEHPAVADAGVHARPDPQWGEAVVATVVLREGRRADERELLAHCSNRLAGFKVPKAISFAEALPRTTSGKLLRGRLG